MDRILDFTQPFDVALLDQLVATMYSGQGEHVQARQMLERFNEHPDAWTKVDAILEYSARQETKFVALGILENAIRTRWAILPVGQRQGIRNYIINLVIKLSNDYQTLRANHVLVSKLNSTLVQIIKKEWPHNWSNFVAEIVGASETNESLCENNLHIFRLLSEEIFDFSSGQLTQAKAKELKTTFNAEFSQIYKLCEKILTCSTTVSLVQATLGCLLRFLSWVPVGYIFETNMVQMLVMNFFPVEAFRTVTLQCLIEIAGLSLEGNQYDTILVQLFVQLMAHLTGSAGTPAILQPDADIATFWDTSTDEQQQFVQSLSLFFSAYFRQHLRLVETPECQKALMDAHVYMVRISEVTEVEVFKICLEYWNWLALRLYEDTPFPNAQNYTAPILVAAVPRNIRLEYFNPLLSRVRRVIISRMARPEEVLIVEDENGEIVKEHLKDSDAITLYKIMRETLIYLTLLDVTDTETIMLEKLVIQSKNEQAFNWNDLNTLCWAVGSISGTQSEDSEKRFLITVIKELLNLCENKQGKSNKAVIASNIMYVVGQYPRFLKAHWRFLKTVVNKLFEFMHEKHEGVQDMACDTFLKIASRCRRKFMTLQPKETEPFIDDILRKLHNHIVHLEPSQIQTFYEAVGCMISAADDRHRAGLLERLMSMPNASWDMIIATANQNPEQIKQQPVLRDIINILKTNVAAATSVGHSFITQLERIYIDMLRIYHLLSTEISAQIAQRGPEATNYSVIRNMRSVKTNTLRLMETFIHRSEDPEAVRSRLIGPLLEAVLGDYTANIPQARDARVLSLMAVIVNKLGNTMTPDVPRIFDAVFECTLEMIINNPADFPDHRVSFFALLRAINQHCFASFFVMSEDRFRFVLHSVVWAFKHHDRHISETGLLILDELLTNVARSNIAAEFYQAYFCSILQDLFFILTDTFHKFCFREEASILMRMFLLVASGQIATPLWGQAQVAPGTTNQSFIGEFVANLLSSSFPNLSANKVQAFVVGLFELCQDGQMFKAHLRDFLVQLKEFSSDDNVELFDEHQQQQLKQQERLKTVPGLMPVMQRPE